MPEPPKIYWDASVFLSYINGDPDRLPDIDAYLGRSGEDIQIVTSVLSVTEVAFAKVEQDGRALDPGVEAKIDALWFAVDSPIRLIEFYPLLATEARSLMREALRRGLKVPKPADAMHMVSAKRIEASEIHTYDDDAWKKYQDILGIKVERPNAPKLQYTLDALLKARSTAGPMDYPLWESVDAWPATESAFL